MMHKKATAWLQAVLRLNYKPTRPRAGLFRFNKVIKSALLISIALVFISSSVLVVAPSVNAASTSTHPTDTARSKALYNALRACIAREQRSQEGQGLGVFWITIENAKNNKWWKEPGSVIGAATFRVPSFLNTVYEDGRQTCNVILSEGLKTWGFSDGLELLCAANIQRDENGGSCQNGTGDSFDIGADDEPAISTAIRARAFGGRDVSGYTPAELYPIYKSAFLIGCKATKADTGSGNRDYQNVYIVDDSTGTDRGSIDRSVRFEGRPNSDRVYAYTNTNFNQEVQPTCSEIAQGLRDYASSYSRWLRENPTIQSQTPDPVSNNPEPESGEPVVTCGIDGLGWIVCPVMNFIAWLNDSLYGILVNFVDIDPQIFGSVINSGTDGLYVAWNIFRTYANVLFVIAFLWIIFSQVTSVGISNYGIKKMLPKLIIAAILVNLSYYLCQIAVDISNILGYGLKQLFESIGGQIPVSDSATSAANEWSWTYWVGTLLAAGVGAAAVVVAALAISFPVILSALLALLMVVVILIARQAIVVILIVIAPLAFVAYLLPNTEKLFKRWWDTFFSMLVLFPVISVLFGAGALAAKILATIDVGDDGGAMKIAALGASVLPLIATIPLLQNSLKATGALGAKLQGMSKSANSRIGSKVKSESKLGRGWSAAMANRASRRASAQNRSIAKHGFTRGLAGVAGGKGYSATLADRAKQADAKEYGEAVERAASGFVGMDDKDILSIAQDSTKSVAQRHAAIAHLMEKGSHDDKVAAISAAHSFGKSEEANLARESIAGAYAKSDVSNLYGKSLAKTIKSSDTSSPIDMTGALRGNFGSIAPQTIAGNENYAKSVAAAYSGATGEQRDAMDETLHSIESTPQLIGGMVENGKRAIRGIGGKHANFGRGAPASGGGGSGGSASSGGSSTPGSAGGGSAGGGSSPAPSGGGPTSSTPPSPSGGGSSPSPSTSGTPASGSSGPSLSDMESASQVGDFDIPHDSTPSSGSGPSTSSPDLGAVTGGEGYVPDDDE